MGYNLFIGNAKLVENDGMWTADVDLVEVDEPLVIRGDTSAPVRYPSYSQWKDFAVKADLDKMFFDNEEGLIRRHPGTFLLTQDHLTKVRAALEIARRKYPNEPIGFPDDDDQPVSDGTEQLTRLVWLEFWIDAALKHCKRPAFGNS